MGLAIEQVLSKGFVGLFKAHAVPPQACPPNLPSQFYLKAKHQLHRGPTGQDAVIGMADEEEVQDTQEEHKGCGDPPNGGLEGSAQGLAATSCSKTAPTLKPTMVPASSQLGTHHWARPPGNSNSA